MLPGFESDYWKETQIHVSKVFILDIVDIVAFFKSVTYRHKKVIQSASKTSGLKQNIIRTETKLWEEASRRKQSLTKGMHLNRYIYLQGKI